MSFVDLFDTPEQAAEADQQMSQLGWERLSAGVVLQGFVRRGGTAHQYVCPHVRPNGDQVYWYTSTIDALFDDPVSCAVALEIKG